MKRRKALVSMVAAAAATIAAPRIWAALAASKTPTTHRVTISSFKFSPRTLSVKTGDRIVWINNDIVPHTATAKDRSWDTGKIGNKGRAEIVVKDAMSANYFCRFHPSMRAKLEIA